MVTSKSRIIRVRLAELQKNLFVREALDHDHVLYLAQLIENGVKLRPIQITADKVVVDGRHRIEAYYLNDIEEIDAEVVEVRDEISLIAKAYSANVDGSRPPSIADTEHTVLALLERKLPKKRIGEMLGLPANLARRYVDNVESKMNRAKLQRAVASIRDGGLNVPQAAAKYEVEERKVREYMSPSRRQKRESAVETTQRKLSMNYKSMNLSHANLFRLLINKFDDGDLTINQMNTIFAHLERLQKTSLRTAGEWKKRFEAKVKISVPADVQMNVKVAS